MKNKLSLYYLCLLMQGITFAQAPKISYKTPQIYAVGKAITPLLATNTGGTITYGVVTSFAGKTRLQDGLGTEASFFDLNGLAVDAKGNIYIYQIITA